MFSIDRNYFSINQPQKLLRSYRVRVSNTDTYTKADSTRIRPSFVNTALARNDLCEFYWTNIRMLFFQYYFEEVVSFFFNTLVCTYFLLEEMYSESK